MITIDPRAIDPGDPKILAEPVFAAVNEALRERACSHGIEDAQPLMPGGLRTSAGCRPADGNPEGSGRNRSALVHCDAPRDLDRVCTSLHWESGLGHVAEARATATRVGSSLRRIHR